MQQIRANLTRLKKLVEEKLPQGPDIHGYQGISTIGILEYLESTYALTNKIEELKGGFEFVMLKRKILPRLDECKEYLNDVAHKNDGAKKFDEFLSNLAAIHDEVYLAHVIYCAEATNSEIQAQNAIIALNSATAAYKESEPQIKLHLADLQQIATLREKCDDLEEYLETISDEVEKSRVSISNAAAESRSSAELISKYESDTKAQKATVEAITGNVVTSEKKLSKILQQASEAAKKVEEVSESIKQLDKKNQEHTAAIATTLQHASRHGMASSFRERKDELSTPIRNWGIVFVATMAAIFAVGVKYIEPELGSTASAGDVAQIAIRISLLTPLIWLGWMAAKQFGYLSRIREDYSFKYASALAFEGYKKEALQVNEDMMKDLLAVATNNMALNPLRIYENTESNHASPLHELLSNAADKVNTKELVQEIASGAGDIVKKAVGKSGE